MGLRQEDVARAVGCTSELISKLEAGSHISQTKLTRVAVFLGLDPAELLLDQQIARASAEARVHWMRLRRFYAQHMEQAEYVEISVDDLGFSHEEWLQILDTPNLVKQPRYKRRVRLHLLNGNPGRPE